MIDNIYICNHFINFQNIPMKRLLTLLVCVCLISTACFSQTKSSARFLSETTGADSSTVVNAALENQVVKVTRSATLLYFQVTATKVSGTTAGVIRLYGSNDKLAWKRVTATGTLAAGDSLNLANVTTRQSIIFKDNPSNYLYYRVGIQGSGTASTRVISTALVAQ